MRAREGMRIDNATSVNAAGFMYTVLDICETQEAEYLDLVSFDIQADIPEGIMLRCDLKFQNLSQ